MKISIIGGTGPQGRGLALRFARKGLDVLLGSREKSNALKVCEELNQTLGSGFGKMAGQAH